MGTDIHPIVEVRRDGRWTRHLGEDHPNRWYRPDEPQERWNQPTEFGLPDSFRDRDYLKFAILGDVRNGFGFAGVPTFAPLTPIGSGRGIPANLSITSAEEMDDALGDHSFGWVSLRELQDYDLTLTLARTGVLDEREFLSVLIEGRAPTSWSGGVSGGPSKTVTPLEYRDLFGDGGPWRDRTTRTYDPDAHYYIAYEWEQPLSLEVADWYPEMVNYLTALVPDGGNSDDVRVVFGFDS